MSLHENRTLFESICEKIKTIYFDDEPYSPKLCRAIGEKALEFKRSAIKFYPSLTEKEFLIEINRFTLDDIREAFKK